MTPEERESRRLANARWRAKNPDESAKRSKAWRAANREKAREYDKVRDVGERSITRDQIRRAQKAGVESERFTDAQMLAVYGTNCHLCGKPIDLTAPRGSGKGYGWELGLHRDHLTPLSKGGANSLENCRPAHALCNISKGAKLIEEIYPTK